MNISRRSLLTSLIAAPAVIAVDRLMPVRLFIPTIYGDGWRDDWEGVMAWKKGERFNVLPSSKFRGSRIPHQGVIIIGEEKIEHIRLVYYSDETRKKYFEKLHFRELTS